MKYDLTRYFVVDKDGKPTATYPTKGLHRARLDAGRLNGPQTDGVIGIKPGRPYRVVPILPVWEVKRREVADLRDARISPEHLEALSRYAREEISNGRLAELLGVSLLDIAEIVNAVQSAAPPAPEGPEGK